MIGVVGRLFRLLLDVASHAGHDTSAIEAARFPAGLDPATDYPWNHYVDVTDDVGALLGDEGSVMEAFAGWAEVFPELVASLKHVGDPLTVARIVNVDLSASDFAGVAIELHELDHGRFTFSHRADPAVHRGSRWGAFVTAGFLAGQPCFIGLPRAHVEILEAGPHVGRFLVTLPPARTVRVGASFELGDSARAMLSTVTAEINLRRARGASTARHCARLGEQLAGANSATRAAIALAAFVVDDLGADFALVWAECGPRGELLASRGTRARQSQILVLDVANERAGALEIPTDCDARMLLPILPLLASALAQLSRIPSRFGLSAAEARVCTLVARGMTNASIAASLALSRETVAEHVSKILRKAGCKRRGELVARWRATIEEASPAR